MITYNDIYEASRKERFTDQLQPLPKNFLTEVANYLRDKREFIEKGDEFSGDSAKTKKQLENAITLFNELMLRRRKKILELVLIVSETGSSKRDFENMLVSEKDLFEDFLKNIKASDKKVKEVLDGGESQEQKNELVCFKEDMGELPSPDGETVGPFIKGQIANIPGEIAKILIEAGKAEIVED